MKFSIGDILVHKTTERRHIKTNLWTIVEVLPKGYAILSARNKIFYDLDYKTIDTCWRKITQLEKILYDY